jgi:hypothetical protein
MCGWNIEARGEIGNLVYSIATEYLGWHTGSGSPSLIPGFTTYYARGIGNLEGRLGHIVPLLGFSRLFQFNRIASKPLVQPLLEDLVALLWGVLEKQNYVFGSLNP